MIAPRTKREILAYKKCMMLKQSLNGINDNDLEEAYRHMLQDDANSIQVRDGKMLLIQGDKIVQALSSAAFLVSAPLQLTGKGLNIMRIVAESTRDYHDSGTSSNNNNNNNNNNNH